MSKFAVYCIADVCAPPLSLSRHGDKGAFFCHLPVPIVDQLVIFSEGDWDDSGSDFEVTLAYMDDKVTLGHITKTCRCLLWKKSSITLPNSMTSSLENGLAKLVVNTSEGSSLIVQFDGQSEHSLGDIADDVMKELNENTPQVIDASKTTPARPQKIKRRSNLYKDDIAPSLPSVKQQKLDNEYTAIKTSESEPLSKPLSKSLQNDGVLDLGNSSAQETLCLAAQPFDEHSLKLMQEQPKPDSSAHKQVENQSDSNCSQKPNKENLSNTDITSSQKLTKEKHTRSKSTPAQSLNEVNRLSIKKMAARGLKKVDHSKLGSAQMQKLKRTGQSKQDSLLQKLKDKNKTKTDISPTLNSRTRSSTSGRNGSRKKTENLVNENNTIDSFLVAGEKVMTTSNESGKEIKRRGSKSESKKDASVAGTDTSVTDESDASLTNRKDNSCQEDNKRKGQRRRKCTNKVGMLQENNLESKGIDKENVNNNTSSMDLEKNINVNTVHQSKICECIPETRKMGSCKDITLRALDRPSGRWGHSLCFVHKNMSVLIGGQGEKQQLNKDSVWTLDTETRRWKNPSTQSEGQKPDFRMGHTATYDPIVRCIYVYGGSKNTRWFHDVHILDVEEWKWQLVKVNGKAPTRAYHSATLYRHELWIFGGVYPRPDPQPDGCSNEMHIFSPVMESWYSPIVSGEKPIPRSGHSATLVADKLIVFGGWDAPISYSDLHILDMSVVEWFQPLITGVPPSPRSWHASCALNGNRLLIHGGYNGDFALGDSHIFNLDQLNWCQICVENPPSARVGHKAICLPYRHDNEEEDEIIIFGGGDNDGAYFDDLYSMYVPFDPVVVPVPNV